MRSIRTASATLLSLLLGALVVTGVAAPAQAETVYRFWAYSTVTDGEFAAHPKGPGAIVPADGSIEGWRYSASAGTPLDPRADLEEVTFDSVCGDEEAGEGEKRVAVLVDYGVEQDAANGATPPEPEAACAVVPADATGLQTLQAVSDDVRTEQSSFGPMLCAIGGYPTTGCGDTAEEATPADEQAVDFTVAGSQAASETSPADDDGNLPVLLGAGAAVLLLGAGGVLMARRNRA